MKRALISDIHSNLEGLNAVLEDIRQQEINEIYCLGDIIGYGPNPRECIDLVIDCDACLLGNHGMICFSEKSIEKCLWLANEVETLARQYYHVKQFELSLSVSNSETFLSRPQFYFCLILITYRYYTKIDFDF